MTPTQPGPRWILSLPLLLIAAACSPQPQIQPTAIAVIAPTSSEVIAPPSTVEPETTAAYISFIINVHDIVHIDDSADTLIRLMDLFDGYGVRGDFYLTAPMVHYYQEQRPDLLERLRESKMTISFHFRPPHPLYPGFDDRLGDLSELELEQTLRDYESYRLDMATGDLMRGHPGGYSYVAEVLGRPPVVAPVPNARWRRVALPIFHELGAQMTLTYHESGTDPENPFDWREGLLIRPSDFSITRWVAPGMEQENFWWVMLDTYMASHFNPLQHLKDQMRDWNLERAPFITVLIHENNFYRRDATPWAFIYYNDKQKREPLLPPYDLNAPDASRPRKMDNIDDIWHAYEELLAYAAAHLEVVTSEDIVRMAE